MTRKRILVLLLLLASSLFAQVQVSKGQLEPAISSGFTWLRNNQNADGSWGGEPTSLTTIFHTTSVVLEAFHLYRINDSAYQKGVQWMSKQNATNVDYLARKAEAMSEAGMNASTETDKLKAAQNNDGGWGVDRGFTSEILDTVLAVRALSTSYIEGNNLKDGVNYLLNSQSPDGGWGLLPKDESNVYYTSLALLGLEQYKHTTFSKLADAAIQNASAWLSSQQQNYGGWTEDGNTIFQTPLATSALKDAGYSFNETGAKSWILAAQRPDGTLNHDAYETALALMATGEPPFDHPPHAAFSFTPPSPTLGQTVQFIDASNDPDGTVTRRHWDFGDGTTSTLQNPTHTYTQLNTYIVTLGVTDNSSNIDSATQFIDVAAPPPPSNTPFHKGDVFAGVGDGIVKQFDPNGTLISTLNTTSHAQETCGMAFDAKGNLYVCDFSAINIPSYPEWPWVSIGTLTKFNILGGIIKHPWGNLVEGPYGSESPFLYPESVVIDAAGDLYVGDTGYKRIQGTGKLLKFDPSGNLLATWSPEIENSGVDEIELATDQHTIYYTSEGTHIKRFDVTNNTQLPDFATLPDPAVFAAYTLHFRANGELLVAANNAVYRLDPEGNIIQEYTAESLGETNQLFALCLDPDGTSFWTGSYVYGGGGGMVYRIDIETGKLLKSFDAGVGYDLAGLVVFGEQRGALPTVPLTISSSDAAGNPKDEFKPVDTVYVTVPATGQQVALYIVVHESVWNSGNALTDVSGGKKTLILNPGPGNQTIQIWASPLVVGSYDIIMDANNNGVYNPGLDLIDSVPVGFSVVAQPPTSYDATINAYCNTEVTNVSLAITMDGTPTDFNTPHLFTSLTGTHTFTVPSTDLNGHHFKQWNTGSTNTTITVEAEGTYTAYYARLQAQLIVGVGGSGTTNTTGIHTYDADTVVSVSAFPDTGWMLAHWLLNETDVGSANPYILTMNANYNLTAVFTEILPVQYRLLVSVIGAGTTNATGSRIYNAGSIVNVEASPGAGWMLSGWLLNDSSMGTANPCSLTMNANYNLTAVFTKIPPVQYSLIVGVTGSGTTNVTGTTMYDAGAIISVEASPDTGWTFAYWLCNGTNVGKANPYTLTMNENVNLTAVFVPKQVIPQVPYGAIAAISSMVLALVTYFAFSKRRRNRYERMGPVVED